MIWSYICSQPDIDSPIQTIYTVADDIGIRFGIDKCGILAMRKGNESECEGITIGSGEVLGKIDDGGYNYLGIIEWSDICQEKKKMSVKIKCFITARLALKSQLNAGNVIQAINIWAVSAVKYPAGIIKWTKKEVQQIDRKTHYKTHHHI